MRTHALLFLCFAAACSCNEAVNDGDQTGGNRGGTDEPAAAAPDWQGPPVRATAAPDGGVEVVVTAPTLGYSLTFEEAEVHGDVADAKFKLTTPAPDAMVGQMITELREKVPASRLPQDVRTVRVRIATWQDGVQYVMAPEHVLAATVRR